VATPLEARTQDLPLRWGSHTPRVVGGGILIISGAVAAAGSDTYALWLLLVGVVAHVAGWCVMPSQGWRRVVAITISTPAVVLLLTGPKFIGVLVLPYIAWLLVRQRPARSFPTITFVLAGAVILPRIYTDYDGMLPTLGIELLVIVASAWAARAVDLSRNSRRPHREIS
jgi:hypothetical protein